MSEQAVAALRAGGAVIASSDRALALREAAYPPVLYIPRADVAMGRLQRTDHSHDESPHGPVRRRARDDHYRI